MVGSKFQITLPVDVMTGVGLLGSFAGLNFSQRSFRMSNLVEMEGKNEIKCMVVEDVAFNAKIIETYL